MNWNKIIIRLSICIVFSFILVLISSQFSFGTVHITPADGPHTTTVLYGIPHPWRWKMPNSGWKYDYGAFILNIVEVSVLFFLSLSLINMGSQLEKMNKNKESR